jgi:cyclophilin family peptidyl-prolyl cis-trans isomerase
MFTTTTASTSPIKKAAFLFLTVFFMIALSLPAIAEDQTQANKKKGDELVRVIMKTSLGDIVIDLNKTKAPISTDNFLRYVDEGFYAGTIFHRVIGNFMIQGGGFTADMQKKDTHEPIKNEWENGLKNMRGSIAMARTPQPNSATSQFYINVVDNPFLDQPNGGAAYAVFGEVVDGMDVVDKIKAVKTSVDKSGMRDVPVEPVIIKEVVRVEKKGDEMKKEKSETNQGE